MSRFAVGQEITPKETCEGLTRGRFYSIKRVGEYMVVVVDNDGRYQTVIASFALTREEYEQAEREKDPFAPGKWVVCVRNDTPAKVGDVVMVKDYHPTDPDWFRVTMAGGPCNMRKSRFRLATPEEIKEQEMKIMDEKKGDDEKIEIAHVFQIDPDIFTHQDDGKMDETNRQTFTVGGREFYVGQTVWANRDIRSIKRHERLEIVGNRKYEDISVGVRTFGTTEITFVDINAITTTKPKPHEWKFGDWARHPECGVLFVTGVGDEDEDGDREIEAAMKDGTAVVLGDFELTYISTAEIPE